MAESRRFFVQEDDDEVKNVSERKLRNLLREGELSGLELVRAEDEPEWGPLYARALYKEEVPVTGDPYETAKARVLNSFWRHAIIFLVFLAGLTIFFKGVPFWMAFWGIGLAFHGVSALKAARTPAIGDAAREMVPERQAYKHQSADPLDAEAEAIEQLIEQTGAPNKASLTAQVKALVAMVKAAAAKERDLAALTSEEERAALLDEITQARAHARAEGPDQHIFVQQLKALNDRLTAIDEADHAKAVLLAKKSVAVNQLKQLRLELSRTSANQTALDDLAGRLDDIQVELSAQREVEDALHHGSAEPMNTDEVMAKLEAEIEERIASRGQQAPARSPQLGLDERALGADEEHAEVDAEVDAEHVADAVRRR